MENAFRVVASNARPLAYSSLKPVVTNCPLVILPIACVFWIRDECLLPFFGSVVTMDADQLLVACVVQSSFWKCTTKTLLCLCALVVNVDRQCLSIFTRPFLIPTFFQMNFKTKKGLVNICSLCDDSRLFPG